MELEKQPQIETVKKSDWKVKFVILALAAAVIMLLIVNNVTIVVEPATIILLLIVGAVLYWVLHKKAPQEIDYFDRVEMVRSRLWDKTGMRLNILPSVTFAAETSPGHAQVFDSNAYLNYDTDTNARVKGVEARNLPDKIQELEKSSILKAALEKTANIERDTIFAEKIREALE